jgi:urease accessory protein
VSVTALHVARTADGRSVVRRLRERPPLGLRELRGSGEPGGPARVAILQRAAHLVGGDDVRLEVEVGDGAALELIEISATLVHAGALARQSIALVAGERSRVCLAEQPLIVAAGARLERRLTLSLDAGARVVHRDTLVLGRHGEPPGGAEVRTRVERAGVPLLDETLATADLANLRSAAVLGGARIVGALGRYGVNGPAPPDALRIAAADTLVRRLVERARDLAPLDRLQHDWTAAVFAAGSVA